MNLKNYVQKLETLPPFYLFMTEIYFQLEQKQLTQTQFDKLFSEIEETIKVPYLQKIDNYLTDVKKQATLEAIRAAKKSQKAFIEYLVYQDEKSGKIAPYEAQTAREMLHGISNPKQDEKNHAASGQTKIIHNS